VDLTNAKAEPVLVRERLPGHDVADHESAMRALVSSILAAHPPAGRAVFVGHAFVQGGSVSDSERPLSVGGAGTVSASNFDAFCYAALGHLHRPQDIVAPAPGRGPDPDLFSSRLRYAGAPLKYSFDEVGQARSVSVVDIDGTGVARVEVVPLHPRRELRRVEGTLDDLLAAGAREEKPARDDYIVARLTDPQPVLDPIGRLRKVYGNILCIERALPSGTGEHGPAGDRRQLEHGQLFAGFFKQVTGQEPTAEQRVVFASVADRVAGREREVPA
jgi:exonuclease SbcD